MTEPENNKPHPATTVSLLVSILTGIVLFYNQISNTFSHSNDKNMNRKVEQLEEKVRVMKIEQERLKTLHVPDKQK